MRNTVKVKEYWRDKPRTINLKKTKFQLLVIKVKRFLKRLFQWSLFAGALYVAFIAGRYIQPQEKIINVVQAEPVEVAKEIAPVLQRIAKCESNNQHYDKNGQVLMRSNNNKSVDVGRYQINSVWFTKATELGLDITNEEDNEKMATWIYENRGTGDWYPSQKCWK